MAIVDAEYMARRAMFPEYPNTDKVRTCREGVTWLRREISAADIQIAIACNDTPIISFYEQYKPMCLLAIGLIKFIDIVPKSQPGTASIDIVALKRNTDIVAVAERYTELKKTGTDFTGHCPFHAEKHGSFFVNPARQTWHCFGACNTGGDVISLVMKAEHIDFKAACFELQRS